METTSKTTRAKVSGEKIIGRVEEKGISRERRESFIYLYQKYRADVIVIIDHPLMSREVSPPHHPLSPELISFFFPPAV